VEGMLRTPRWAMADALDVLQTTYGGIETYLLGPAGLSTHHLESLRQRLIE
jgi:Tyrosine phosphatase family